MREGVVRNYRISTYTLLYLTWITNRLHPTVYYRKLCSILCGSLDGRGVWERMGAQSYVAAWMGEEFGREWVRAYV